MLIGYARVSELSQSNRVQTEALTDAGCAKVYEESASGRTSEGRGVLQTILDDIREGDTLVVMKLDRLGRSTRDILDIVHELEQRGAHLRVLEPCLVDTSGSTGKIVFTIFNMVADTEQTFIRERRRDGIAKAKAAGVYKGRPAKLDYAKMAAMMASGIRAVEIAKTFGCSRGMVYRALAKVESAQRCSPPTSSSREQFKNSPS